MTSHGTGADSASSTSERAQLARQLGAHEYIDSADRAAGAALADRGGADLIVCTATDHVG